MKNDNIRTVAASAYGVLPQTGKDVTPLLQRAIDRAAEERVCLALEEGSYICGTLYLRSHTSLCIPSGARLLGNGDSSFYPDTTGPHRYLNEEWMNTCFIYAEDAEDIRLFGGGEINGNARAFHDEDDWTVPRPMLLRLRRCRDIVIEDLRLFDPASWTSSFLECENVTARRLNFRALVNLNGDGLDFDGCRNVLIEDCAFLQSDDCICLTCHDPASPMEDVVVRRCRFSSWTDGVRIGMNSAGDIRNVLIENCAFENVWREGIKIESTEGGTIEKLRFENLFMLNVRRPFYYLCNNAVVTKGINEIPPFGKVAHVRASHIEIADTPEMTQSHFYTYQHIKCVQGDPCSGGIRCDAPPASPLEDIEFSNITYLALGGVKKSDIPAEWPTVPDARYEPVQGRVNNYYPDWSRAVFLDCRNVDGLKIKDVSLRLRRPDEREKCIFENCRFAESPAFSVSSGFADLI